MALPKGGGAIRGIGEKFAANPVTGTGSMSVPIATSPGRSGFGPQLSLSYDSGAGNAPFGFGWSLSLPSITRKTDKGLPQYFEAQESDVFILSGAEDLVPVLVQDAQGKWAREKLPVRTVNGVTYRVDRYRPRIEGLFARIERWTNTTEATDVFWRSISKGNITTWYGRTAESRITDPDPSNPGHTFSWLICQSHDDKGNVIAYRYKAEDSAKVFEDSSGNSLTKAHERNRTNQSRTAQRYLKRIRYGNRSPYFPELKADAPWPEPTDASATDGSNAWHFEVVFDYGEHDANAPTPNDAVAWPARTDPFSSYRAGFEVRTYRTCQRVLMFHHFSGEAGVERNCLVRSTDFTYSDEVNPTDLRNPVYTFLQAVTQTGYRRNNGGYDRRSLPPVEFEYVEPKVQETIEEVDPQSLESLPIGLDGSAYRWTDLHGEGIPGILTEQAGAWFYTRNLGPLTNTAQFAPLETVALKPNVALGAGAEIMDLAGDGQPDVVVMEGPTPGLYEHDEAEGWQPFRPFTSRLNRNLRDPNIKFVDLDGDGHADVLITEDDAFVWHASLAEDGFGPARRVAQTLDEEKGPRIVFADGTQSIYLADLSGDGLTDIVRIRNGEVCYWPNLGYGRFGAKVTMDNAPWFDHPDQFDHKRVRLADIDGSGTTDILYVHRDGVRLYFNQSGNGWSQPHQLKVFPRVDDLASIVPTDLLGNGTACLVWSSPLPGDARRPMRYVNLMGGRKPHLLVKTINNLGAETRVDYTPSTKFYLQDKRDGKPWITRLPFPVHVVERVETYDHISRNRFVTGYAYHHGYFDGEEREFRGFGMVEQWDTEQFAALAGGEAPAANIDGASHVPPVLTRTWFHTGIGWRRNRVSNYFAGLLNHSDRGEYYREPAWLNNDDEAQKRLLPDTILPPGLTAEEEREAARSLKGMMLRREIYALDGVGVDTDYPQGHPYTVAEQNFTIRQLQPTGANRHAVFFTHAREALTYHYERNPSDPRIQHALTLEVDDFGNVLRSLAVGYGRGQSPLVEEWDRAQQTKPLLTYTENAVTHPIGAKGDPDLALHPDVYRAPLPAEALTYELTGFAPPADAGRFAFDEWEKDGFQRLKAAQEIQYEEDAPIAPRKRLIERTRTLYRPDDCGVAQNEPLALLAPKALQPLALPGESYKLAFTPGLLDQVFKRPRQGQPDEPLLPSAVRASTLGGKAGNQGGYVDLDGDGHWWIPSGRSFYHPNDVAAAVELAEARAHGFLPRRYRDPFGQNAVVDFDVHDLLMVETRDALGNRVTVDANDYRVLQPRLVSDPNRNQTEVAFDTLGMVVGTAVMGKPTDNPRPGDRLDNLFSPEPPQALLDAFIDKPREAPPDPNASAATQAAHDLLAHATTRVVYDLTRYMRLGEPPFAATIARETHLSHLGQGSKSKLQLSFSYSDGFGREIQKKIQAEPGPLDVNDPASPIVNPRWVGSGWTIFNNKGKPVRQYEPFFSKRQRPDGSFYSDHRFEFGMQIGVSPVLFYDPAERVVATLHPNRTWEKVVFDPWQQETFDVNDTLLLPVRAGDPLCDADVAGYFGRLLDADYLPTWHELRTLPAHAAAFANRYPAAEDRQNETKAAERAAGHANTPTTAHFDALGRPFLIVARNRVVCPDHDLDSSEDSFATRVELDIEGNQRAVRDAILQAGDPLGRIVMRYANDMLGNRIHQFSMEAGARWMLNDVAGKPVRAWDSRGHNFTTTYDALRRPVEQTVRGNSADSDPRTLNRDIVVDKIEYGESVASAEAINLRTRIYRHFDSAGVATNARLDANGNPTEAYDFKGNLLRSARRLVRDYTAIPDWLLNPQLEDESFEGSTRYDALNRPIQSVAPRSSLGRGKFNVIQPAFNEANLLERVDVWLERAAEPSALFNPINEAASPVGVANIDYDAKGQRLRIDYKNGASTFYSYDPLTFRLTQLLTRRKASDFPGDDPQPPVGGWPGKQVQNLRYTYDPAGNITHIQDDAQQTIYFRNKRVEPSNDYIYDALYRLIQADGREHLGQLASGERKPPTAPDAFNAFHTRLEHPGNGQAMGTYTERYVYDAVGNFLQMQHRGSDPVHAGWTRSYDYLETSLIEDGSGGMPLKASNRLTRTTLNPAGNTSQPETYLHDAHGNMLRMPHLGGGLPGPNMHWDYRDQLRKTDRGGGGAAFYVCDASGQRVRKVWEKAPGLTEERIYFGGFEIFRKHGGPVSANTATLERETLHVMDDKRRIALVETRTLDLASSDQAPRQLIRYQFGNHLGSASLEVDEQAQIISYEEYAPYGSSTYQAVRSQTETAKRYRYSGKERDEESGLYYHGARYYAAWLARWTSSDPQRLAGGINLFAYAGGRPTRFIDSSGLAPELPEQTLAQVERLHAERLNLQAALSGAEQQLKRASDTAMHIRAEAEAAGKGGLLSYFSEEQKFLRAAERDVARLTEKIASVSKALEKVKSELSVAEKALREHGLEWYAKGLEAQGEKEAAAEIRKELIETTEDKFKRFAEEEAKKAGKKPPGGGGGGTGGGGGAPPSPSPAPAGAGGGAGEAGTKAATSTEARLAEKELEKGGEKLAVKALKGVGKVAVKAAPIVGIGAGVYFVKKDIEAKEYGRAVVDTAEAVPVVGDIVLAGDVAYQVGAWGVRAWSNFVADWTVSTNRQLRDLKGEPDY